MPGQIWLEHHVGLLCFFILLTDGICLFFKTNTKSGLFIQSMDSWKELSLLASHKQHNWLKPRIFFYVRRHNISIHALCWSFTEYDLSNVHVCSDFTKQAVLTIAPELNSMNLEALEPSAVSHLPVASVLIQWEMGIQAFRIPP
jgi:hypothetical protein